MSDLHSHISWPCLVCRLQPSWRLLATTIDNPWLWSHISIHASLFSLFLSLGLFRISSAHLTTVLQRPINSLYPFLFILLSLNLLHGARLQAHSSIYALVASRLPSEVHDKIESRRERPHPPLISLWVVQVNSLQSNWIECLGSSLWIQSSMARWSLRQRVLRNIKWPTRLILLKSLHNKLLKLGTFASTCPEKHTLIL